MNDRGKRNLKIFQKPLDKIKNVCYNTFTKQNDSGR